VNQVLREIVADALERIADTEERLRLVTVTGVHTSSDLRHATVYLSSLDDMMSEALEEIRVELQRAIGTQVRMKRTPHLEFAADPAVAHGMRVEEILRRVHEDETELRPAEARADLDDAGHPRPGESQHGRPGD